MSNKRRASQQQKRIKAEDFDKLFDEGADITPYLDLKSVRLVEPQIQRVNVDLPDWVVSALDNAATRRGIARQALVKHWLVERLDEESEKLVKKHKKAA
jgi:hypothetical protein